MKSIFARLLLAMSLSVGTSLAHADLQPMDNSEMEAVNGQGGAYMSLDLRLNQNAAGAFTCGAGAGLTPLKNCRLAASFNNRNHDGTPTGSPTGRKLWLVFKGIQGGINFQQIKLEGADIQYTGDTGVVEKGVILLTFDPSLPVLIRNFGFSALSLETDTVANEGAGNVPGYLAQGYYNCPSSGACTTQSTAPAAANQFDGGREVGFMGLNMHGNLSMGGSVKVFGCSANHPRC